MLKAPSRIQEQFVSAILREASLRIPPLHLKQWYSIYFGGGTPSALEHNLWLKLLESLNQIHQLNCSSGEFSVESNPESTTKTWVQLMSDWGVNRFSLGVQSFNDQILQKIQRNHNSTQAMRAIELLLNSNYKVNADFIFDLPEQSSAQFHDDLRKAVALGLPHISFYGLQIEAHTLLDQQMRKGIFSHNQASYSEFYHGGVELLEKEGLNRYEISNFARPGHESLHNLHYWQRGEYLGLGPGAHSFINGVRYGNPRSFVHWLKWVDQSCPEGLMELDEVNEEAANLEKLWLGLRQNAGINIQEWQKLGISSSHSVFKKYVNLGWMSQNDGFVQIMRDGWVYLDDIIASLASIME